MDDNRDKDMMRNQLIAIVLMTVLFVVWFKWFMPQPQPKKSPTPVQQQATQQPAPQPRTPEPDTPPSQGTWPELPAVPQIDDPAAEEIALSDGEMELVFTRIGARLKRATLILGEAGKASLQLVPIDKTPDTEAVYPLGLQFTDDALGDAVNYRRFDAEKDASGKAVTFTLAVPGKGTVRKRFSIG